MHWTGLQRAVNKGFPFSTFFAHWPLSCFAARPVILAFAYVDMTISKKQILLGSLILLCIFSTPAAAEVMDKEMSIPTVWAWALSGAILGFFAITFRWWLGFLTSAIFGFILYGVISEWNDPSVGPAIAAEAGVNYGLHAYFAISFLITGHFVGWMVWSFKYRDRIRSNSIKFREHRHSADR